MLFAVNVTYVWELPPIIGTRLNIYSEYFQ